jgi:structure-specific recognition protein 1
MESSSQRHGGQNTSTKLWNCAAGWLLTRGTEAALSQMHDKSNKEQDIERISKVFKNWYSIPIDQKEHSLRGWNWGKSEFGKAELQFNVQNRPSFEIPYSEISNTNLAGKNEVAVEFALPLNGDDTGTNGALGGARGKGKKAGAGKDQLVEMRFYIPGVTTKKAAAEGSDAGSNADGDDEEQNAANLFYDTLMEKAEIGEVAGDTYATFLDVLHLTPRYVYSSTLITSKTLSYFVIARQLIMQCQSVWS